MKTAIFDNTDWAELQQQKEELLGAISYYEDVANCSSTKERPTHEKTRQALTGILHLIDAFQDHAVDELGLPESVVFPGIESDPEYEA